MGNIKYILICSLLFIAAACEKFTEPAVFAPAFSLNDATEIGRVNATLSGNMTKAGGTIQSYGFIYGELENLADGKVIEFQGEPTGVVSTILKELTPGKRYYYCIWASSSSRYSNQNNYDLSQSEIRTFQTSESSAPSMSPTQEINISEQSITVKSGYTDKGGYELQMIGIAYREVGSTKDKLETVAVEEAGNEEFTMTIEGLKAGVTYIVRSFGINIAGMGYGESIQVTTIDSESPVVSTGTITPGGSWINASAEILSPGFSNILEQGFCWSETSDHPTLENNFLASDSLKSTYRVMIPNLKGTTRYYVRAYARNSTKVGYGKVVEIITLPLNLASFGALTATNVTTNSINIECLVSDGNGIISSQGFCCSNTLSLPDIDNNDKLITAKRANNRISGIFEQLTPGKTYYIRAYAVNESGIEYSQAITVSTTADPAPGEDDNDSPEL